MYKNQKVFKKIASNTIAQIASKTSTAIISIFLLSILTNYLSIELFGLYNKVYNYLSLFAFLADLGLYTIAIREISKNRSDQHKIVGNIMSLRLILGLIIMIVAVSVAFFLPGYNSSLALISIFVVSFFTIFSLINSAILALMQANMKIEFNLVSTTLGKLATLGGVWAIAFLWFPKNQGGDTDFAFLAIIFAGLCGMIINTLLNYWYAKRFFAFRFLWDTQYIKHIIKISLPYGMALFLSVVYFKVDIILLSLLEPKSLADTSIAFYSLPMKIVEVLMVLGGFYLNSILPLLSTYFHQKKIPEAQKLLTSSFQLLFTLGSMFFVLGVLLRYHIIHLIAKPEYLDPSLRFHSADAMIVVLGVVVFYFISNIFNYIFIASEHHSSLLKINSIVTVVNIVGNIILIPYLSFIGSGIVTIVSQIVLLCLGYYYSKNIISFSFGKIFIGVSLFFSVSMYFLGIFLQRIFSFSDMWMVLCIGGIISFLYAAFFFLWIRTQTILTKNIFTEAR